jgi:hypothetical protein
MKGEIDNLMQNFGSNGVFNKSYNPPPNPDLGLMNATKTFNLD